MTELDRTEMYHLLQRLPHIELSYETIPHTKVSPDYNICLGIPIGTKCYAWITFYGTDDVCFIMELNKDRKIARITYTYVTSGDIFANGTLFYGTKMNDTVFIIEDILMYKGISAKQSLYENYCALSECVSFQERIPKTGGCPRNRMSYTLLLRESK